MKRLGLYTLLIIGLTATANSHANNGAVAFSGNITTPTCAVTAGGAASGTGAGISLNFGEVSMSDLRLGGEWADIPNRNFSLIVTCTGNMTGYRLARATLDAAGGSGINPQDRRLLHLTAGSTAEGVGLSIWEPRVGLGAILDLSTNPGVSADFQTVGTNVVATINLHAMYARTSAAPRAGTANATLPFTVTYE